MGRSSAELAMVKVIAKWASDSCDALVSMGFWVVQSIVILAVGCFVRVVFRCDESSSNDAMISSRLFAAREF